MTVSPDAIPWACIGETVATCLGADFVGHRVHRLPGDGAAAVWRMDGRAGRRVLVKTTTAANADDLAAERNGLEALAAAATGVRVPRVIALGVESGCAFLLIEFVPLQPLGGAAAARLGTGLAALHGLPQEQFGWSRDNLLGRSRQSNTPGADWLSFWREQRLRPQSRALAATGAYVELRRLCETLCTDLDGVLGGHRPQPSLLHGDLWTGNLAEDESGVPVVFDPAVYRGDREVDLAMMSLFGGVPGEFESAYRTAWPLPRGYRRRRALYNLHHAVNHVLLFGAGWESLALRLAREALGAD